MGGEFKFAPRPKGELQEMCCVFLASTFFLIAPIVFISLVYAAHIGLAYSHEPVVISKNAESSCKFRNEYSIMIDYGPTLNLWNIYGTDEIVVVSKERYYELRVGDFYNQPVMGKEIAWELRAEITLWLLAILFISYFLYKVNYEKSQQKTSEETYSKAP